MMHRVKDMSPEQRHVIEALLGRTVASEEAISVRAVDPAAVVPSRLSAAQRTEALRRIDEYFNRTDAKSTALNDADEEVIFLEAMRSVRPGFRPAE